MAISIRGGIHRPHDQKTTLPPMSASVCAPHFLVLPAVRPLSHVPPCRGGGSARVSDAPLQLHVRRHGTALHLHDPCGLIGRMTSRGLAASSASGSHLVASTGRLPTSWSRRPVSMRTGASAQLRSSMRPSEPLRAVPALPSASSVPRREFAGRCCVDRIALRSWSCQSGALGPSAWTKGAARTIAIGSLRRRSRESARVRTQVSAPSPRASRPRTWRSARGRILAGKAVLRTSPARKVRAGSRRSILERATVRDRDSARELRQRRVMNSVG